MNFTSKYQTEIGWLEIIGDEHSIFEISFSDSEPEISENPPEIFE